MIGGFVVKELSSDPPKCLLTYVTRADLKGRRFFLHMSSSRKLLFRTVVLPTRRRNSQ